ncbi:beta-glucosidase [Fusarium albosuccineum]|uniref:Beta-glucosidase cel3A n=1 Tax=Fusarium albosuccineum TaxID=1237068 RepID=A0A8H4LM70_9HYPO|nr:beta-glucosidase [Fusarium albosuccineum]
MGFKKLTCLATLAPLISLTRGAWNHDEYLKSPGPANATGLGWEEAFAQATDFVLQLTLHEKLQLVSGTEGPCVGNIAPINRLNFSGLCIQNGPMALEQGTYTLVFPAGLTIAATWDKSIAYQRGTQMGDEFRGKGSQVLLGPVAGPLGRHALGGRNWEGFSPDPYLIGELFTETIRGIQDAGVQACAKHYIGNEQETQRQPTKNAKNKTIESVSSNIDDRTMHELYLWPFQQAVRAGVATVMCSYNRLNQTYGCQNSKVLNGLLKDELGFQGYVMSDWGATHSGAYAINAGEDMDMPGLKSWGTRFFRENLVNSIKNGSVSIGRVNDMCHRVLTPYFKLKQNEGFSGIDPSFRDTNAVLFTTPDEYSYQFNFGPVANIDVRGSHAASIREAAAAGTVLLKNVNNTLPLKSPKRVGIFGNDAGDFTNGMSYWYFNGVGNYEYGVLAAAGGSGSGLFTYVVNPLEAIKQRVGVEGTLLQYVLNNTAIVEDNSPYIAALLPSPPDVCLVFLKSWATESEDRTTLNTEWHGDKVVERIASTCPNTVVITHSGGINLMPWADHPNVTAILAAHLPGQEAGNSIVDVLWGDVNPSGHLPYTIAKDVSDYSFAPITNSTELLNTDDPYAWQADFKEGLLIDYRHFDYYNKTVRYEFGFGLSYTTSSIANVTVKPLFSGSLPAQSPPAQTVPGGNPHLWDILYELQVTVNNNGAVAGAAVPQLYLRLPGESGQGTTPNAVLRGFEKVYLEPGERRTVVFDLNRRDISYWDIILQQWTIGAGEIQAHVGFSSRDFQATSLFSPIISDSRIYL